MRDFRGKVAVVTGAASGIGRALAERCGREGMQVVLADIEEAALARAAAELKDAGAAVLAVHADVSKPADVERLASETLAAFGGVHLLCNNAGVGAGGAVWDSTQADWEWVLGVNLWGVIYGVRTFVPIMLRQDTDCHIVNTASVAGLLPYHFSAPYQVTKFAVVGLSENMYFPWRTSRPRLAFRCCARAGSGRRLCSPSATGRPSCGTRRSRARCRLRSKPSSNRWSAKPRPACRPKPWQTAFSPPSVSASSTSSSRPICARSCASGLKM